jgi:hypothetical protein
MGQCLLGAVDELVYEQGFESGIDPGYLGQRESLNAHCWVMGVEVWPMKLRCTSGRQMVNRDNFEGSSYL